MDLHLAWDSGTTDGDPGEGRVRVDAAVPRNAAHLIINNQDRFGALVGEGLAGVKPGDVLHVVREGAAGTVVAWVLGQVINAGSYCKVPVAVRSIEGSFAAHDLVRVTRQIEITAAADAAVAPLGLVGLPLPGPPPTPTALAAQSMDPGPALAAPSTAMAVQPAVMAVPAPAYDEAMLAQILAHYRDRISALEERCDRLERYAIVDIATNIGTRAA